MSSLTRHAHFPDSSVGKESACNAGDPSLIPGSGRSPEEGIGYPLQYSWAFLVSQMVKNPPAKAEDVRDVSSIPGLGRSPGGGHGNPLQYSCLENSMDKGAWWAIVRGVTKSQTWLKRLSIHTCIHVYICVCILSLYCIYIYILFQILFHLFFFPFSSNVL